MKSGHFKIKGLRGILRLDNWILQVSKPEPKTLVDLSAKQLWHPQAQRICTYPIYPKTIRFLRAKWHAKALPVGVLEGILSESAKTTPSKPTETL